MAPLQTREQLLRCWPLAIALFYLAASGAAAEIVVVSAARAAILASTEKLAEVARGILLEAAKWGGS